MKPTLTFESYRTSMLKIAELEKRQPVFNSKDYNELQQLYRECKEFENYVWN